MKKIIFAVLLFFMMINHVSCKNITYVALGDSITTGYLASEGYAIKVSNYLKQTYHYLEYHNYAINGLTSKNLISIIEDTDVINNITESSIITLSIGSNDILSLIGKCTIRDCDVKEEDLILAINNIKTNLDIIVNSLIKLNNDAYIFIIPYYNPYNVLSSISTLSPYITQINNYKDELNNYLKKYQENYHKIIVPTEIVDVLEKNTNVTLNPLNLDPHPNNEGHNLIFSSIINTNITLEEEANTNLSDSIILVLGIILSLFSLVFIINNFKS